MTLPTDEQVEAYFRAKLNECMAYFNYSALSIEIRGFQDSANPTFETGLYANGAIGTVRRENLTSCISHTLELLATKPEAQILREKAAELIASAEKLENQTA